MAQTRVELDGGLEAAVEFYGSVFPDARLLEAELDDDAGPGTPRTLRRVRLGLAEVVLELADTGPAPDAGGIGIGVDADPDSEPAPVATVEVVAPDRRAAERWRSALREGGSARGDVVTDRFGVSWRLRVDEADAPDGDPRR